MLMQAYRRAYGQREGNSRLSQEGLLRLMGQVDPRYLERYNHSTVARWESGATTPTRDRLEVFGRALELSEAEIDGLIRLSGLYGEEEEEPQREGTNAEISGAVPSTNTPEEPATAPAEVQDPRFSSNLVNLGLTRVAFPGLLVAGSGYLLASLGWNASWVMILYITLAIGLVLVQGFLKLRRSNDLRELYFMSVFFLLGGNLLLAPVLRMDPYGFYAIGDFGGTPIPYLLALIANLLLALIAGLIFDSLCRLQYASSLGANGSLARAALAAFPPLGLVYLVAFFLFCLGAWIYLLAMFAVMGAVVMGLLVLRDKKVNFTEWQLRLLLQTTAGFLIVLTAIGGLATIILYLEPSVLSVPNHTLIRSWEIDFDVLGYSMSELMDRYRIGAVWSSVATIAYMVIALGGSLLLSIARYDSGEDKASVADK